MAQPIIYAEVIAKSGLQANLPSTGVIGQLFFTTDEGNFYVWNGSEMVQVNSSGGPVTVAGFSKAIVAKTTTYTAAAADDTILANASGGGFTITLHVTGIPTGKIYTIKKTDSSANIITLSPASGTIDGQSTVGISTQYQSLDVQFDGTNWWIV
jgi:hypothetical protein